MRSRADRGGNRGCTASGITLLGVLARGINHRTGTNIAPRPPFQRRPAAEERGKKLASRSIEDRGLDVLFLLRKYLGGPAGDITVALARLLSDGSGLFVAGRVLLTPVVSLL